MLLNVFRVMVRRWYIVLAGLLLTAGLAYGATVAASSEYTSRALILVLPSEEGVGEDGNPFLALGGLEQPASLVTAYFSSTTAQREVAERSSTATYLVALDEQVRGPVILVQVSDASAEQSLATLDYLTERIPQELRRLQDELRAPESSMLGSMLLQKDVEATEDNSAAVRLIIAAIAVGLLATVFLAHWADGPLTRRAARRAAAQRVLGDGAGAPATDERGGRPASRHAAAPPLAAETEPHRPLLPQAAGRSSALGDSG